MDFMLYAMAIGQLRSYFGFDDATAGMLGTITLVMSGVGGVLFGYLADRLGRTRALMGTILLFSIASLGAATSQSVFQLLLWRALLGIGMGGEWASGAVLISETWPPAHRNKAISIMQSGWAIGYIIAALMAALILGGPAAGPEAWRWLFLVASAALFTLVDPPLRARARHLGSARAGSRVRNPFSVIFGPDLRARTLLIILLGASVQFGYWGIFFWLPAFLARPISQGGAGMGVVGSLGWIIPVQIGAYFGYLTFGFIADRLGRRPTFIMFMLVAATLVPIYGQMARSPVILMLLVRSSAISDTGTSACSAASSRSCSPPPCARRPRARATTSGGWRAPSRPTRSARLRRCRGSASAWRWARPLRFSCLGRS